LGWFFDFPDADNYLDPFATCTSSVGLGFNYCTEEMDALVAAERAAVGTEGREEALIAAQDHFAENVIGVPLWVGQSYMVWDLNIACCNPLLNKFQ
jgi:peptide/nickel transport system substrate-binding protein